MRRQQAKTLYVDVRSSDMALDGNALRITTDQRAPVSVPVTRVGRAVIHGIPGGLLEACLEIVGHGGTVHFETGSGKLAAVLRNVDPAGSDSATDLAQVIEAHGGLGPFHWWRDAQLRHAWSLVFRRGLRGDFVSARHKFALYLNYFAPEVAVHHELGRLDSKLHAWLQAEINDQGLHPIVRALAARGGDIVTVLRECLGLTSSWAYVRWRRQQLQPLTDGEQTRFFELHAANALPEQLQRHLRALASEYHTSWHRLRAPHFED
ncbi:hypothetical protein [Arhodomonas sp. AD133]|uniref:hypothetical protein n=1 Tax=Arhodomonas sp. AD133 TaxID=3415009 RepID=UPI003EB8D7B6